MQRRTFTKLTDLSAVAVTTTGFIKFDGATYVSDCETTSDILGPYFRPDSPMRSNLMVEGMPGNLVELSGIVRHKDCGTTLCNENGEYSFKTQMPVPYDAGGGMIRPAHFNMMVSAPGHQSLVTQIYFTGDPYLEKDASSSAP